VNYRGSTGYGQKHADAIFQDQNGGEAKDVLAGVDAALAKYAWLDSARLGVEGGSYGGQLTNWLITQTDRFKAAIPAAGISNLVSFNYMAYYHDYLAVEFGGFPHEPFEPVNAKLWPRNPDRKSIMDALWERSPIRYVAKVKTPTLFLHGENDNDVPIAEAEQYYIALRDVGVDSVLVRYPREGHGIRETKHVEDTITRSLAWYRKYFERSGATQDR
jgi:dipeptidyl aminopeptidase/acylaminoacyl peptidase